jgi:hypothetical protein
MIKDTDYLSWRHSYVQLRYTCYFKCETQINQLKVQVTILLGTNGSSFVLFQVEIYFFPVQWSRAHVDDHLIIIYMYLSSRIHSASARHF